MDDIIKVNIDLSKIRGAFRYTMKGSSADKECLCIPIENLYQGRDGTLYLNLDGLYTKGKYGQIYALRELVSKEEYFRLKETGQKLTNNFVGRINTLPNAYRRTNSARQSASGEVDDSASAAKGSTMNTLEDLPF